MHYRHECEHGVVVKQCRCPGGTVTIVPCPPSCTKKEAKKIYNWEDELSAGTRCGNCVGTGYTHKSVVHPTNPILDTWERIYCTPCKGSGYL